jgi:hypothetical protein
MPKFKPGDIIKITHVPSSYRILAINSKHKMYTLQWINKTTNEVGITDDYNIKTIENVAELDVEAMALEDFDQDLEELLNAKI